ncbi:YciI family protein [Gordonia zhaorongruii]|uniref:YciI family protein n=1 Tax=Gordonia zhaorongruii TaxID=2597659 RepID=UPI0010488B67|nr:YciI family protein [Gordonia zhaorongruii]
MPIFHVEYTYAPDATALRDDFRPEHREFLGALHDAGDLLMVGPFLDGSGATLLVSAENEPAARALLARDPFAREEAIAGVRVVEWKQVFGPF